MCKRDVNLLRPLTLDDIKPGTLITWLVGDKEVDWGEIVYAPLGKAGDFVIHWNSGTLGIRNAYNQTTRLTPLAWVEDKPVYPGDVLYGKWEGAKKGGYAITGVNPNGLLMDARGIVATSDNIERLTWTPPKTKHRVWVNLYPDGTCSPCSSEEYANAGARPNRIECRLIEWES